MHNLSTCPRCLLEVAESRLNLRPAVCDACGFVLSKAETEFNQELEKRNLSVILGVSVVLVASFMMVVSWGGYSVEIIPLAIGQWFNLNSAKQNERLVQIGLETKKYDLVEKAYLALAQTQPEALLRLGKFQMSRGLYPDATISLRKYIVQNNSNIEAHYLYARALAEIGQVEEATPHFEYVLRSKPGVRQITVVQNYVRALIHANHFEQARQVILQARGHDQSAATFMDTEYKVIVERIRSTRS